MAKKSSRSRPASGRGRAVKRPGDSTRYRRFSYGDRGGQGVSNVEYAEGARSYASPFTGGEFKPIEGSAEKTGTAFRGRTTTKEKVAVGAAALLIFLALK